MKRIAVWAGALALAITWAGSAQAQSTLAAVKAKGYVQCGRSEERRVGKECR